ncbi:ABC transporter permease [Mycolicibacterium aichiense]|uniref:ABC transporter permease n=1 Tax=Mycolicibacterium aichiense TaxID=1799 RepID=UPI003D67A9D6
MTGVAALAERSVRATLRDDLPFAILAPAGNLIVFNFLLASVIDTGSMSYPQYVLPAIVIQVIFLGALTTIDRASVDGRSEFGIRLGTLPIPVSAPLMARMVYCLIRGALSLLAAIAVGYMFGFRMVGGFGYVAAFVIVVVVFTLALSLAADAMGSSTVRSASSQLFLGPQMLLVMLSTGMAPVDSFPNWLHSFVQYQPVSQVTETLRGFASGHVLTGNLAATAAWCLGMLAVFGALAIRMQRRPQ